MKVFYILLLSFLISFSAAAQLSNYSVTVYDSSLMKGYYFLTDGGSLRILDKDGGLVFYKPGKSDMNFALQANGLMTYFDSLQYYFMDSAFTIIDSIRCTNNYTTDRRELRLLPNGHYLLLGSEVITKDLKRYSFAGKQLSDTAKVRYALIQEQDTDKKVVFEWHAKDYFKMDDEDTSSWHVGNHTDLMHSNSLELDDDGNILLSTRNYNEITKINHRDGSVMWRMGGKRNQFKFVNCPVPFYGQHDVRRISNGHITLFDNGDNQVYHAARALEFELDEKNKIATLKWSYVNDSTKHSLGKGNVQRLDHSNTLISYGDMENDNTGFVVVNSAGSKILEVDSVRSYRVLNYSSVPWQLHRPEIVCFDSLGIIWLKTAKSYPSYRWSDSETTSVIPVVKTGSYNVFVPYGKGGNICSEKLVVTDILHPCMSRALELRKKLKSKSYK